MTLLHACASSVDLLKRLEVGIANGAFNVQRCCLPARLLGFQFVPNTAPPPARRTRTRGAGPIRSNSMPSLLAALELSSLGPSDLRADSTPRTTTNFSIISDEMILAVDFLASPKLVCAPHTRRLPHRNRQEQHARRLILGVDHRTKARFQRAAASTPGSSSGRAPGMWRVSQIGHFLEGKQGLLACTIPPTPNTN